jgi:hypothetical protein
MKSPAYWNALLYELSVKLLWRKKKSREILRWEKARQWIPKESSVVEVAAGTGRFYLEMLYNHVKSYLALDINPAFVNNMTSKGIHAHQTDLRKDPIPDADVVVMISALYHFKNIAPEFLKKLQIAARDRVIIVEPVSQPLDRRSLYDRMRAKLVDIGEGPIFQRYSKEELLGLCKNHAEILHFEPLPDNELLIVLCKKKHSKDL